MRCAAVASASGPKAWWHVGVKEEGADAVIKGAKDMLSAAVLLRSVRASETKDRAVCGEKVADRKVIELLPVVCLQRMNGTSKLRGDIGVEGGESGNSIRLSPQREGLHIVRKIIKYNKIIKISHITCSRRSPNITMN